VRKKVTAFDFVFITLLLYSLVPFSREILLFRFGGVPVGYIPFLIFFAWLFLRELVRGLRARRIGFGWGEFFLAILLFIYLPFQLFVLKNLSRGVDVRDYLLDYAMFCTYGITAYFGTRLYFVNQGEQALIVANRVVERMLNVFFIICIVAPIRYFLFDHGVAFFYSTFNVLPYRMFVPLFLVPSSLLALGRFFATRRVRYLLFFALYGGNIYLCQSRTGYIAYACVLGYLLIRERLGIILRPQWVVAGLVFAATFYMGGQKARQRIARLKEIQLFASLDLESAAELEKDKRRIALLVGSLELFQESPWLGVGLGKRNLHANFPSYYLKYSPSVTRPHNFYLSVLISLGIFGSSLLFLFLFFSVYRPRYFIDAKFIQDRVLREFVRHLYLCHIAILVMQLGYEFETTPFIWFLWGLSSGVFRLVGKGRGYQENAVPFQASGYQKQVGGGNLAYR